MAGGNINVEAVDRVLAETPAGPIDEVKLRADEVVKLRQRAALADQLERDAAGTLTAAAITEATASVAFVDEIAASHARTLLRERIIIKPDEHGRLAAFDRETGRPAAAVLREVASGPEFERYRPMTHSGGAGMRTIPTGGVGRDDDQQARRAAVAARMTGGRMGPGKDGSFGGFANGRHGA